MTVAHSRRYALADGTIDAVDIAELIAWLQTNPWLTQGPLVREFESVWATWLGRRYSLFVNSGSSANLLMYYAALLSGRLDNMKVIVPAVSWATTVAPAIQLGFEPIMCEADWQTFGLDLPDLERLCEAERPGAVIVVHTLGVPAQMDGLLALQRKYHFLLMEDACPATGSTFNGKHVGTFGDMASFSFYFGHHLSTIEGGMVSTDDEQLQDILLHIRGHGWAKDISPEKEAAEAAERGVLDFNRPFTFYYPGFNFRSTDLNAHIGLTQMRKADDVVVRRIENQRVYEARFRDAADYHFPSNPNGVTCSISFVALAATLEHRDRVGKVLAANGVETRPLGGGSMGRQPFWSDRHGTRSLPVADAIHQRSFMLPNNPALSVADIEHICDLVLAVPGRCETEGGLMRVLVTGGAGYIGSVLVPMLLREGHAVTVVDSLVYGQTSLLDVCHDPNLTIIRGDARDEALMRRAIADQDLLIPLAALVGAPLCAREPEAACSINVGAVELMLRLRSAQQRVLYPNTNSGYGLGQGDTACTEQSPLKPISLYGRTKCQAEQLVLAAGNSVTFRLATVFGVSPRMRLDLLVNDFTYRAVSDGFVVLFEAHFKRNFIHVRDVARVFLHAISNFEAMQGEPYNVGLSDSNLSKTELCDRIRQQVPRFYFAEAAVGEDPDKRNYIVSNAKIEATGFRTKYSLDAGITELLKAYQVVRRSEYANV